MAAPTKVMSSKLASMKFMQRAAASSPSSATNSTDERSSKRQRTASGYSSRGTSDDQVIQAALDAEAAKREELLERQAVEAGESKWVLDVPGHRMKPVGFTVVSAGYSTIDAHKEDARDEEEEQVEAAAQRPNMPGRTSYGGFGKQEKKPVVNNEDNSDSDSESGSSESDDDEDGTGRKRKIPSEAAEQLRAKRQARKQAEKQDLVQMAERRRNKEVKLNSISSGGQQKMRGSPLSAGPSARPGMECYTCGGPHMRVECPQQGGRAGGGGRGGKRPNSRLRN